MSRIVSFPQYEEVDTTVMSVEQQPEIHLFI